MRNWSSGGAPRGPASPAPPARRCGTGRLERLAGAAIHRSLPFGPGWARRVVVPATAWSGEGDGRQGDAGARRRRAPLGVPTRAPGGIRRTAEAVRAAGSDGRRRAARDPVLHRGGGTDPGEAARVREVSCRPAFTSAPERRSPAAGGGARPPRST